MKDYEALTQSLQFQGAIFIQPLEEAQVYEYFDRLGVELEGVRSMLTTDTKLLEMAKTPLMANIMAIAYRGMSVTDLIKMSLSENHVQHLFDTYIDRMLRRRPDKNYPPSKVKRWLGFLARQLKNESQTIFLIERIQPSWLQNSLQATLYATTFIILPTLLISEVTSGFFLIESLLLGLTYGLMREKSRWWVSLLAFISCFTIFPFIISTSQNIGIKTAFTNYAGEFMLVSYGSFTTFDWGILFTIAGLVSGLIFITFQKLMKSSRFSSFQFGLIASPFWLAYFVSSVDFRKLTVIEVGYSLTFFVIGTGFISYILWGMLVSPINPLQKFSWSWQNAKESANKGMIWGLIIGLVSGLVSGFLVANGDENRLRAPMNGIMEAGFSEMAPLSVSDQFVLMMFFGSTSALVFALIAQPICALVGGIVGGRRGEAISNTTTPNEGIRQSVRTSLLIAIATILLSVSVIFFNLVRNIDSLPKDLFWILTLIGVVGFWSGILIAVNRGSIGIKHLILRVLLFFNSKIPWNYAEFLNYITDCILLQKIGGGYVFAHRLLLEHFSEIYNERN